MKYFLISTSLLISACLPAQKNLTQPKAQEDPAQVVAPLAAPKKATRATAITKEDADVLFQKRDWPAAQKAYDALTAQDAKDGMAWLRLGLAYHFQGQYDKAIPAYHRAEGLGFATGLVTYNLACAYALKSEKEKAFAYLNKSMAAGFDQPKTLREDKDLLSLQGDPRFQAALARAEENAHPCTRPEFTQLDFLVGEWEIQAENKKSSQSSFQKILDGCVLVESFSTPDGFSGQGIHSYNAKTGKWQRIWVDNKGQTHQYQGEAKEGKLVLMTEDTLPDGAVVTLRVTTTPAGQDRLTRTTEKSKDGGETWHKPYEVTYLRKH